MEKNVIKIENGNMFAATVTIDPDDTHHFLKTCQKSHKGNMQTVLNEDGARQLHLELSKHFAIDEECVMTLLADIFLTHKLPTDLHNRAAKFLKQYYKNGQSIINQKLGSASNRKVKVF